MNDRSNESSPTLAAPDATGPEGSTTKRSYQKPVLNQVGLLRDLTQFYF